MSATELAVRNRNRIINTCTDANPHAVKIIDVDCEYDDGRFIMSCLPCPLPELFTIRFTAPEDFVGGNVLIVKDKELPVRTPGMLAASTDLFKAGAVVRADIDLTQELAFCWQSESSSTGQLINYSLKEQPTGKRWLDGRMIYQRTYDFGAVPVNAERSIPHDISNFDKPICIYGMMSNESNDNFYPLCFPGIVATNNVFVHISGANIRMRSSADRWKNYSAVVTIEYVCSDR